MADAVHLAISTCPNDTYAFSGLLCGAVDTGELRFAIELLDIAELNRRLFAGDFDVAKASFHAALYLTESCCVLPVGAALGYGVGPLLLSRSPGASPDTQDAGRVLCPGPHTTATLLYRMFHPGGPTPDQVVFSDIMPALQANRADFGVCIHEGRFTWAQSGLHLVEDLGERWEREANGPLPLGGILARRTLGDRLPQVTRAIARSLVWADAHRDGALQVMRAHAQELSDEAIWSHVELYVNDDTRGLSPQGRAALRHMYEVALDRGILSPGAAPLTVV